MSNSELFYLQRIAEATERIGTQLQRLADQMCDDVAKVLAPEDDAPPAPTGVQGLIDMDDDLPPAAVEPEPVDKTQVVAALNAHARAYSIDSGKKILNSFAPRLDEVLPEQYAALVALLKQGPSV